MTVFIYDGTLASPINIVDSSYDWFIFTKDSTYDSHSSALYTSTGTTVGSVLDFYGQYEVDTNQLVGLMGTLDGTSVLTGISNARITIHEGAELVSYAGTAVRTEGTLNNIVNYGLVTGSTGFRQLGGGYTLQNYGTISATNYALYLSDSAGTFELLNEGMITGPYRAIYGDNSGILFNIVNRGTISAGSNDAIQLTGDAGGDHYILNEGVIFGGGRAMDIDADDPNGGTLFTTNSGTIYGFIVIDYMMDVFRNTGTVDGRLDLNDLNDKLFNHGTITRDVDLGVGDDVYRGTGAVLGEIQGDAGADRFFIHGDVGAVDGGDDTDRLNTTVSIDDVSNVETIYLRGDAENHIDVTVTGTTGALVKGNKGDNAITGGDARDTLKGRDGDDNLNGGAGDDILEGGGGVDILNGGLGTDELLGGGGADVFVFDDVAAISVYRPVTDWILDFGGSDVIDLSGIASFDFIANDFFSASGTAELRYRDAAGDGELQLDIDGDGNKDYLIMIEDKTSFNAGDFIL